MRAATETKTCRTCNVEKSRTEFWSAATSKAMLS